MNMIMLAGKQVFATRRYIAIATAIALVYAWLAVQFTTGKLIFQLLGSDQYTALGKVWLSIVSVGNFATNMTLHSQIFTVIIAALVGINISMLSYLMSRRAADREAAGAGILGVMASFFGIGCASCGPVLLSTLFGTSASLALTGALPLGGMEISLVSIALILFSTHHVAKNIMNPAVCKIKHKR